ncbi:MAG: gliding motility-associated C-terminal domain-containing protein, partial [Actinobacteria bacterium]|nr:gliding motility-associated C-terminal domain-containing protein [Actinomycetota bacterium]
MTVHAAPDPACTDAPVASGTLAISSVSDAPDSFSPDGDTQFDSTQINYSLSRPASVTVRICDASNATVRLLVNNKARPAGSNHETWDGKDGGTSLAADGLYTYVIDATDAGDVAVRQTGDVLVDTRQPITLTSPAPGTVLAGTVDLVFSQVPDYTITGFEVYRRTPGGGGDVFIGNPGQQPDGSWKLSWDTTGTLNGSYEFYTRTIYLDGRGQWMQICPYYCYGLFFTHGTFTTLNGVLSTGVSDGPDSFSPNGDGQFDTTSVGYNLPTKDADVTIRIYDAANTLVRTLLDAQPRSPGTHSETWDGKNDASTVVPDGLYTYTIDATDGVSASPQRTTDVLVDTRQPVTLTSPAPGTVLAGTVDFVFSQVPDYAITG